MLSSLRLTLIVSLFMSLSVSGVLYNSRNGAYTDIIFAIGVDVKETEGIEIIDKIKQEMAAASEVLKVATKQTKSFGEVKFLIPSSWEMEADSTTGKTFETADIKVTNALKVDAPFVSGLTGCGETRPDVYMGLKPGFIIKGEKYGYGTFAKTFVHEWGHFRWGLLDEYRGRTRSIKFYVDSRTRKIEAMRCSYDLTYELYDEGTGSVCKVDERTGVYTSTCKRAYNRFQTATASIMNYQHLDSVVHFCDDTDDPKLKHNRDAPSIHNIVCSHQSAWEVMRRHSDFRTPVEALYSDPIKFSIIKEEKMRSVVLVFDTSGSMKGSKISELHSAATNLINNGLADGLEVGLVKFSSSASTLQPLTELSDQTRTQISAKIPSTTNGGTSIGAGLQEALEMLRSSPKGARGSTIMLLSDGEETESPYIRDVLDDLTSSGVIVNSVLFTASAENSLISLSQETGGKPYFTEGVGSSTSLSDVFTEIAENINKKSSNSTLNTIPIASETLTIGRSTTCRNFTIDSSANQKTKFTVIWYDSRAPAIKIISPSGQTKDYGYIQGSSKTNTSTCNTEPCEVGTWQVCLGSKLGNQRVQIEVQSQKDKSDSNQPIKLSAKIYNQSPDFSQGKDKVEIFAEVLKGNRVVVGAKVYAVIEVSGKDKITLKLEDTGSGADIESGDGTYSGYLFSAGTTSRYSVIVKVVGLKEDVFTQNYINPLYTDDSSTDSVKFGEDFERYDVAGFFEPTKLAPPNSDFIPPAKIVDLQIKEILAKEGQVTLTWTSVGDDFDKGNVSDYEVMMYDTVEEFRNSTSNGVRVYPQKNQTDIPPYQTVEMTFSLKGKDMCLFSVQAVDDSGLKGGFSFPVTVTTLNLGPPDGGALKNGVSALVLGLSIIVRMLFS